MKSDEVRHLLDWKRRTFDSYAAVRRAADPAAAWSSWRATKDEMFASHPQSPIPEEERSEFTGLHYFEYDPAFRVLGTIEEAPPQRIEIATSGAEPYSFERFGTVRFALEGSALVLDLFWLLGYGGGLYLPFRDLTSGDSTYGAGRYIYDTVKGADLGEDRGSLVLDFNFAYNPSCSYDPRWVCPLAPPANRLDIAITAGEQMAP